MKSVHRMRLVSNNIGYGPCPEPDDEVEQCLILSADGDVHFFSFYYGDGEPYDREKEQRVKTIPEEKAQELLSIIAAYFEHNPDGHFATDVGEWTLTLTSEDGTETRYEGSLCDGYEFEGKNLSKVLREAVGMTDLFAFDDRGEEMVIERIALDYHRVRQVKNDPVFAVEAPYVTIETTERLIISREAGTVELVRDATDGVELHQTYRYFGGVDHILDSFDEGVFQKFPETPPEAIEDPKDIRRYVLTVELSGGDRQEWNGHYDKFGVPLDLEYFISVVLRSLNYYKDLQIFDPELFMSTNRVPEKELIFCSCSFKRYGPTYYYLSDDPTLRVGDFVLVPVGSHGREKVVRIEQIDVRPESKPLFDPDQTKHIISRCEPDEEPNAWTPPPPYFCPLIGREVTDEECVSICLVVQDDEDPSSLSKLEPPPKWSADKENTCWECEHAFGNSGQ